MKKNVLIGLSAAILLAFGFLSYSCAVAPEPASPPPRAPYVDEPPRQIVQEIETLIETWEEENIDFIIDREGNMRLIATIFFRADAADFAGLRQDLIASNNEALDHVAEILRRFSHYNILIEGNANPISPPGPKRDSEEPRYKQLSEQRAVRVYEELSRRGVPLDRKSVTGVGTIRPLYPYNDSANNWRNRRVEFILIRK